MTRNLQTSRLRNRRTPLSLQKAPIYDDIEVNRVASTVHNQLKYLFLSGPSRTIAQDRNVGMTTHLGKCSDACESTGSSTCEGSYGSIFRNIRMASSCEYEPLQS